MPIDEQAPKRRGRPAAPLEERRRHNLTFRIRSDLRNQIQHLAETNGRSISEEIEFLLELNMASGRIRIKEVEELAKNNHAPKFKQDMCVMDDNGTLMHSISRAKTVLNYTQMSCVNKDVLKDIEEAQTVLTSCFERSYARMLKAMNDILAHKPASHDSE